MTIKILLGTYTRGKSKGIYQAELDIKDQKLKNLTLLKKLGNPTYLDQTTKNNILYTIITEKEQGGIASLVKNKNGIYHFQSMLLKDGPSPAYIAYDEERQFIYSSNYHKGELSVYSSDNRGNLKLLDTVIHSGSSIHKNQKNSHIHYSNLTPDKKYLIACDLGSDQIYTYQVNFKGKLKEKARLKVKEGSGPRHLTFHPNGKTAYLFAELSSEIIVLNYHTEKGEFTEKQTISSIPKDYKGINSGAAIRVTSDGRFIYASNRGHDSIAVFSIEKDGKLTLLEHTKTKGKNPRDFNLDPSESFIVVGHQHSNNLTLFKRNEISGLLTLLQKDFYAPEVVNITF